MNFVHSVTFSTLMKMSGSRSLEEIKVEMDLLCLDIENLQDGDKIAAVKHIEDSLRVIKLGSSIVFQQQSHAKREKVDIDEDEAQSIEMKTEENKVRRIGRVTNPTLALINHSCDPNYRRVSVGTVTYGFACKPIGDTNCQYIPPCTDIVCRQG